MNLTSQKPTNMIAQALSGLWGRCKPSGHDPSPLEVLLEKVGRGNSGKSTIEWALIRAIVSNFFPSGLQLDVGDPQQVAQMIQSSRIIRERLEQDPLLPTLEATPIRYTLFEGEKSRIHLSSHEVIGQILTATTPESPPEWQARFRQYMGRLSEADVLWAILPTPPAQATGADRERFEADLKLTTSYVRRALELRQDDRPVALAIVLAKLDTLFPTAQAASEGLSDESLRFDLSPLVTLATMSDKVHEAAIIPTAAFGFGAAIRKPDAATGSPADSTKQAEEGQWLLEPGTHVVPFNLGRLTTWTLFHGMARKFVDVDSEQGQSLIRVRRLLRDDLDRIDGWSVVVKSQRSAED
jgi:hypothetical protein